MSNEEKKFNFDMRIALDTASIIFKTTIFITAVTAFLLLVMVVNNRNCMSYQPKHAKSIQQIELEEKQKIATKDLFRQ